MSVPVAPRPRRIRKARSLPLAVPLGLLVVAAAAGGAVAATAPAAARTWVAATVATAWALLAVTTVTSALLLRRGRRGTATAEHETRAAQTRLTQLGAESAHLLNVTLPSVVKRVGDGVGADETLESVPGPSDPQLRRLLEMFTTEIADSARRGGGGGGGRPRPPRPPPRAPAAARVLGRQTNTRPRTP
ncbi:ATP-binding protein, partial [Streptomyces sp. NPDC059569]